MPAGSGRRVAPGRAVYSDPPVSMKRTVRSCAVIPRLTHADRSVQVWHRVSFRCRPYRCRHRDPREPHPPSRAPAHAAHCPAVGPRSRHTSAVRMGDSHRRRDRNIVTAGLTATETAKPPKSASGDSRASSAYTSRATSGEWSIAPGRAPGLQRIPTSRATSDPHSERSGSRRRRHQTTSCNGNRVVEPHPEGNYFGYAVSVIFDEPLSPARR